MLLADELNRARGATPAGELAEALHCLGTALRQNSPALPQELLQQIRERAGACTMNHRHRCEPDLWEYLRLCRAAQADIAERIRHRARLFAQAGMWCWSMREHGFRIRVAVRLWILAVQGIGRRVGLPIKLNFGCLKEAVPDTIDLV